ncbi:hypothetical protein AB0B13_09285 [Streptomyces sp. NPDC042898]|uniref:hypothetical protein n=1 Tax=Streptomyces sp. NPDC042898 TaxID=3154334 RepID=UPI00340EC64E
MGQIVGAVALGLIGLWLAHSYRRQVRMKHTDLLIASYAKLWQITEAAPPDRRTPLTDTERTQLAEKMYEWYFEGGNGLYIPPRTRALFFAVRGNLVATPDEFRPAELRESLEGLPPTEAELRRGCALLRQVSILRTHLKRDLRVYFRMPHGRHLRADERAVLEECGIAATQSVWTVWLTRSQDGSGKPNTCICALC